MDPAQAAGVRALAAWLQARRELTERVEVLLMHGPTAVSRVQKHLDELRAGYERELAAFAAFAGPPPEDPPRGAAPEGSGTVVELPRPTATRDDEPDAVDALPADAGRGRAAGGAPLRSITLPP